MSSPFSYTVNNTDVLAKIALLETVIGNDSIEQWLLTDGRELLQERTTNRFTSEGDDVTGPWAPLKDATISIRQALGYGGQSPINRRTGDMQEYIEGDPGTINLTGNPELEWPAPGMPTDIVEKITTAQQGRSQPNTVPRPVLGINDIDADALTEDLATYIAEGLL